MGAYSPGNYTVVNINVLATMDVKNCKGTQPVSTSEKSFNFLTFFFDYSHTATVPLGSGGMGNWGELGGGSDHHSHVSGSLVNVHDTKYLSSFSQDVILETSCKRPSLPFAHESFDCIPYLSLG